MDTTEYPVRIVKFGIMFFGDKATAAFNEAGVSISKNGVPIHSFTAQDIAGGAVNDMNGLWTILFKDGHRLNIVGLGSGKREFNSRLNSIIESLAGH